MAEKIEIRFRDDVTKVILRLDEETEYKELEFHLNYGKARVSAFLDKDEAKELSNKLQSFVARMV